MTTCWYRVRTYFKSCIDFNRDYNYMDQRFDELTLINYHYAKQETENDFRQLAIKQEQLNKEHNEVQKQCPKMYNFIKKIYNY